MDEEYLLHFDPERNIPVALEKIGFEHAFQSNLDAGDYTRQHSKITDELSLLYNLGYTNNGLDDAEHDYMLL